MKLTRSKSDTMIAGVCAGIANRLGWPTKRVRIVWALLTILSVGFPGIIAYLVLWFLMPEEQ